MLGVDSAHPCGPELSVTRSGPTSRSRVCLLDRKGSRCSSGVTPHCLKSRSALAEPQMDDGTLLDLLVQT